MESTMQVRDFRCNNCGSPLDIPKGSKGKVVCPSCKTECVIEGLVKNAEIQQKENINSGVPLTAEVSVLHNTVVNALTGSACMPLDVLEQSEITKEEHLCVPAYLFYCNALGNFNYEAGNMRQHKNVYNDGKYIHKETENYLEWTQMAGSVSTSATLVASGNREFAQIITRLFGDCSSNTLIDIEELEFPYDVNTFSFNQPQSVAFNDYCKPILENELVAKAEESLSGKTYRNVTMGGTNIQKDEMLRVFLGLYRITFTYNNTEYVMYITGDGKRYICDAVPVDAERQQQLADLHAKMDALKKPMSWLTKLIVVLFIVGFIGLTKPAFGIIVLLIAVGLTVLRVMQGSNYKNGKEAVQKEIDAFNAETEQAKQAFFAADRPLKGIYSPY